MSLRRFTYVEKRRQLPGPESAWSWSSAAHAFPQRCLYNAGMSKSITVRDVPDETSERLASRAAATGRSLQEYLRARLIELAESPDADALFAAIRARKSATRSHATIDQILSHRDADRR